LATVNVVVLAGTVTAEPVERRMPSGHEVKEIRVSVPEASKRLLRLPRAPRAALGISQEELARLVGTSHSAISRIESGRHKTSVETLQRLAHALGARLVLGFESGPVDRPVRELISA
jgi:ribosome-binding protein aMBF1 (putative translation factor)